MEEQIAQLTVQIQLLQGRIADQENANNRRQPVEAKISTDQLAGEGSIILSYPTSWFSY